MRNFVSGGPLTFTNQTVKPYGHKSCESEDVIYFNYQHEHYVQSWYVSR